MSFRGVAAVLVTGAGVILACGGGGANQPEAQTGTTTTTSAGVVQGAVNGIAMARCDREELCNNVGAGKKYVSRDACVADVLVKGRDDLRAQDCPTGVDGTQLDMCIAEIRGERCGSVLDAITRLTACRSSALCPR